MAASELVDPTTTMPPASMDDLISKVYSAMKYMRTKYNNKAGVTERAGNGGRPSETLSWGMVWKAWAEAAEARDVARAAQEARDEA